eukprot:scaffold7040_cov256-Pinguiococcus_pyrenoidosus.AAC.20
MELVYTYASQLLQTYDEVEMAGRARVPICPPPVQVGAFELRPSPCRPQLSSHAPRALPQDMIERPGPIRHPKETAAQT